MFTLYLYNLPLLPRVLPGWKEDLFSHGYNIIKDKQETKLPTRNLDAKYHKESALLIMT